jgi:hypothetical protein
VTRTLLACVTLVVGACNDWESLTQKGSDCSPLPPAQGDLATGPPFWLPGPALPGPRFAFAATTSADGTIYAIGGLTTFGRDAVGDVTRLDPSASPPQWTSAPSIRPRFALAAAAGPDGTIYALAGDDPGGTRQVTVDALSRGASAWSSRAPLAHARSYFGATFGGDGRLYVAGGDLLPDGVTPGVAFESYAPDSWRGERDLPEYHNSNALVAGPDGNLYLCDLYNQRRWSPDSRTWSPIADLAPERQRDDIGAVLGADGRIYDIGGEGQTITNQVDAYTPGADRWSPVANLAAARYQLGAARGLDGRIYAIGGSSDHMQGMTNVEVYGPTITLTPTRARSGDRIRITGDNFAANARVRVYVGGAPCAAVTGSSDPQGRLNGPIELLLPPVHAGIVSVRVIDEKSRYPAFAQLTTTE